MAGGFASTGRGTQAFAAGLDQFSRQVRGRVDLVMRGVASEVATRLAERTPVLTGRLVGNWHASVNVEDFNYDENRFDPGRTDALSRNLAIISRAQAGDRIFINNSTPYLQYVEFGTTTRPPQPIVRAVLVEVPQITGEVIARVRSQQGPPTLGERVRAFFGL